MAIVQKSPLPPTKVWTRLSQWLPPRTTDTDYWWKLTGLHLAKMLEAAGYSADDQLDALLFHYHWIVSLCRTIPALYSTVVANNPLLGPIPRPGSGPQQQRSVEIASRS